MMSVLKGVYVWLIHISSTRVGIRISVWLETKMESG